MFIPLILVMSLLVGLGSAHAAQQVAVLPGIGQAQDQDEPCSKDNPAACVDGVSAAFTSGDNLRMTADGAIVRPGGGTDAEEEASLRDRLIGNAAGDDFSGFSIWGGYDRSDFEDNGAQDFDSDLNNCSLGIDTFASDNILVGLSLGY